MLTLDRPAIPTGRPGDATGEVTQDEARVALKAVLRMFELWKLDSRQQCVLLGDISLRTLQRWKAGEVGQLPRDTIFRLGCLLGIHKALRYMFAEPERAYEWVKRENAAFGGHSALQVMLQGNPTDLARVRAYLDAERGGW